MKRHLFKILTITICIVTILNFVLPNVTTIVYADTTAGQQDENSAVEVIEGAIGGIADGIVGLLTWPLRILIVAFGYALRLVIGGIASIAGGQFNINISPQDILFDKLEITDVNFFIKRRSINNKTKYCNLVLCIKKFSDRYFACSISICRY